MTFSPCKVTSLTIKGDIKSVSFFTDKMFCWVIFIAIKLTQNSLKEKLWLYGKIVIFQTNYYWQPWFSLRATKLQIINGFIFQMVIEVQNEMHICSIFCLNMN